MSSESESLDNETENDLEIIEDVDVIQEESEAVESFIEQAEVNNEGSNELSTENQHETETDNKKVIKPKRVIKNPQPKLNELTLQGPKGLSAIQSYFDRVKFKGRGFEEQDLNVLLKTYEYWCHRLYPKFPFDDCIAKLEKLGTKRGAQTEIKRIRMGLVSLDPERPIVSDDEEENHTGGFVDTYNDQFDQLLPSTTNEPEPEISEEQIERIRQNKERAERLREERLRRIQEKAKKSLEPSNEIIIQGSIPSTSNSNNSQNNVSGEQHNSYTDKNQLEDVEEDIENILDFINAEEKTKNKNKGSVLESDSEDDIIGKINEEVVRKRHILESDEGEKVNAQNENNKCESSTISDEDEDEDIENILSEINASDKNIATTNIVNEENKDDNINFENKNHNTRSGSAEENDTEDVLSEMSSRIEELENTQSIDSPKSKLSDTCKTKHSSAPKNIEETMQDNHNRLIIQNRNAVDDYINDGQVAENDIENILSEINSEVIDPEESRTLYINESRDAVSEKSKEITDICNDDAQEGNVTNKNEVEVVEANVGSNGIGNILGKTTLDDNSYQTENEDVRSGDTVENKSNTNETKY